MPTSSRRRSSDSSSSSYRPHSSSSSSSSRSSGSSRSRSSSSDSDKFIPNLSQLQRAIKDLPDPELWSEKTCKSSILVDKKQRFIEFTRKRINRGSSRPYRWIYEGKVLIRKRDSEASS